ERWTVAAERFPQQFVCALGKARALMYAEAYEDTRSLLDDIGKRFRQPAQIKLVEQLYAQLPSR
ncbi:hypothetical protein U5801_28255, partial [Lamprobacter modestohalophilus]|uniref:hypothetical protein n=1 Tax=Lamprobacter modestohalophilus TaxID=1064514 RepID=UPI002ADEEFB4